MLLYSRQRRRQRSRRQWRPLRAYIYVYIYTYIYMYICICACVSVCVRSLHFIILFDFFICEKSTKSKANGTNGGGMSILHRPIAALYICLIPRRTPTHSRLTANMSYFGPAHVSIVLFGAPLKRTLAHSLFSFLATHSHTHGRLWGSSCRLHRPLHPPPLTHTQQIAFIYTVAVKIITLSL